MLNLDLNEIFSCNMPGSHTAGIRLWKPFSNAVIFGIKIITSTLCTTLNDCWIGSSHIPFSMQMRDRYHFTAENVLCMTWANLTRITLFALTLSASAKWNCFFYGLNMNPTAVDTEHFIDKCKLLTLSVSQSVGAVNDFIFNKNVLSFRSVNN